MKNIDLILEEIKKEGFSEVLNEEENGAIICTPLNVFEPEKTLSSIIKAEKILKENPQLKNVKIKLDEKSEMKIEKMINIKKSLKLIYKKRPVGLFYLVEIIVRTA